MMESQIQTAEMRYRRSLLQEDRIELFRLLRRHGRLSADDLKLDVSWLGRTVRVVVRCKAFGPVIYVLMPKPFFTKRDIRTRQCAFDECATKWASSAYLHGRLGGLVVDWDPITDGQLEKRADTLSNGVVRRR